MRIAQFHARAFFRDRDRNRDRNRTRLSLHPTGWSAPTQYRANTVGCTNVVPGEHGGMHQRCAGRTRRFAHTVFHRDTRLPTPFFIGIAIAIAIVPVYPGIPQGGAHQRSAGRTRWDARTLCRTNTQVRPYGFSPGHTVTNPFLHRDRDRNRDRNRTRLSPHRIHVFSGTDHFRPPSVRKYWNYKKYGTRASRLHLPMQWNAGGIFVYPMSNFQCLMMNGNPVGRTDVVPGEQGGVHQRSAGRTRWSAPTQCRANTVGCTNIVPGEHGGSPIRVSAGTHGSQPISSSGSGSQSGSQSYPFIPASHRVERTNAVPGEHGGMHERCAGRTRRFDHLFQTVTDIGLL